jgi:hypothetical protein
MAIDSGYPVDLVGRRVLGQNARPRDGQPHSGIAWQDRSDLCDTSRPEMGCAPPPPPAPAPAAGPDLLRACRPWDAGCSLSLFVAGVF